RLHHVDPNGAAVSVNSKSKLASGATKLSRQSQTSLRTKWRTLGPTLVRSSNSGRLLLNPFACGYLPAPTTTALMQGWPAKLFGLVKTRVIGSHRELGGACRGADRRRDAESRRYEPRTGR